MADELLYGAVGTDKRWLHILRGGSEHLRDSDIEIVKLTTAAKVGMAMMSDGMVDPYVEIMTGGAVFRGIILGPVIRPSDSWGVDDDIDADAWVYLLKRTGGRLLVAILINGYDTPLAVKAGQFCVNTEDSAITNDSIGGLFADATEITAVSTIGIFAEDFTTGDSTAAINGTRQLVWY